MPGGGWWFDLELEPKLSDTDVLVSQSTKQTRVHEPTDSAAVNRPFFNQLHVCVNKEALFKKNLNRKRHIALHQNVSMHF